MTLSQYYNADDANKSNIFALSELAELRASTLEFLTGFEDALKKDSYAEGSNICAASLLKDAHITKGYLVENKESLLGLGQYLLDFRGFNDKILEEADKNILGLAYIIFAHGFAFEEAHFRLLEITKAHKYALMLPRKDNVAKYIIDNLSRYSDIELKSVLDDLKQMDKKVRKNGFKLEDYPAQYNLYLLLKKKFSLF